MEQFFVTQLDYKHTAEELLFFWENSFLIKLNMKKES